MSRDAAQISVPDLPPALAETRAVDPAATADLAARIGAGLGAGDLLLLSGDLGSGKTHFARSLIQSRQSAAGGPVEEVPSPSFTLVQTYQADGLEIWHADLYRLSGPEEVYELGLDDALSEALCLIEWPERMGAHWPEMALWLLFALDPDAPETRHIALHAAPDHPLAAALASHLAAR